ncbi:MAG: SMI1/KNR4 family protein [Planctomycetota bacterium]
MDRLIKRLRERAGDAQLATDSVDVIPPVVAPPVSAMGLEEAERRLGFALPTLLRRIFREVGNGGFGPAYGLLGLPGGAANEDGKDCVALYELFTAKDPDDPHWRWPNKLVPLGHLGCGMFACVDCSDERGAVVWFEPNPHADGEPWDDCFLPLVESVQGWLEAWLGHKEGDLYEQAWKSKFTE